MFKTVIKWSKWPSDQDFLNRVANLEIDLLVFDEIYKLEPSNTRELKTDDRLIYMNKVYLDLVTTSRKIALLGPYINSVSFEKTKIEQIKEPQQFLSS